MAFSAPGPVQTMLSLFRSFIPGPRMPDGRDLENLVNSIYNVKTNFVATAGGGFAGAAPIESNRMVGLVHIGTVVTAADSVLLPYPIQGKVIQLWNDGAASCQLFSPTNADGTQSSMVANGGRTGAAVAGNVGLALASGACSQFVCFDTGIWKQMTF